MPNQSLTEFVESPEVIVSTVCSKMESARSSRAKKRQLAISQKTLQESFLIPTEGEGTLDCMFCNDAYKKHEELGKHVLIQHKATLLEPTVLCVEAEYLSPQDKRRKIAKGSTKEDNENDDEVFNCEVCGETFIDLFDLKAHMKRHKVFYLFSCNTCGRRFKEPWFLKNHERFHFIRAGGKKKTVVLETPTTINEVVQEQMVKNVTSHYKICMVCGFHFNDKESLLKHNKKMHCKGSNMVSGTESATRKEQESVPKEEFMGFLNLKPKAKEPEASNTYIKELNPFITFQAWQLATKGKVGQGFGRGKEPSTSFNMETDSDKDEIINNWITSKMSQSVPLEDVDIAKSEDCAKATPLQDLHEPETPKREEKVKVKCDQDKKLSCTDCGKVFRTYQQVVVHSRVHRKDRSDSESSSMSQIDGLLSTSSPNTPASVEDQEAVKMEDVSESEGVGGGDLTSGEKIDGQLKPKKKGLQASRECSYCGRSFRSNYYLNIHLRTHTGEKPYKCDFCDYTAAQKTSLRYHLEKHHKFKPGESNKHVRNLSKNLQLQKKSPDPPQGNVQVTKMPNNPIIDTKEDTLSAKPPRRMSALRNTLVNTKQLFKREQLDTIKKEQEEEHHSIPSSMEEISLACEETLDPEMCSNEEETSEESPVFAPRTLNLEPFPLDLSVKPHENIPATLSALFPVHSCLYCPYTTLYPEQLNIHQRLFHKQNYDLIHKNNSRSKNPGLFLKMRRTGCPSVLKGKDVSPMPLDGGRVKISAPTITKTVNHEKPKRAPAQSNKVIKSETDCNNIGQENKFQSVQQVGSYRYSQPVLQCISHLLESMPQPEQKLFPWTSTPQTSNGNLNVSQHPFHMIPSLFGETPFPRAQAELNSFPKSFAQFMPIPASNSNHLNTDILRRLHPSQVNMHNQERPSNKAGPSVLTDNVPHPCEMVLPCWNSFKPYHQPPPAATPVAVSNPPVNQESDASVEVKENAQQRLSKRACGQNEKRP